MIATEQLLERPILHPEAILDEITGRLPSTSALAEEGTHMMYLRPRYYDPTPGRFNRLDPWAGDTLNPLSLNKYMYGESNPVLNIDPTGLFSIVNVLGGTLGILAVFHIFTTAGAGIGNTLFNSRSQSGLGGLDITHKLYAIRSQYISEWKASSASKKQSIANSLSATSVLTAGSLTTALTFAHAWDIHELAFSKGANNPFTNGNSAAYAEDTVTVMGQVHFQEEVNYFLWGLINRLAYDDGINGKSHNLNSALNRVYSYRMLLYPHQYGSGHIDGRAEWTKVGWDAGGQQIIFAPAITSGTSPFSRNVALPNATPNTNRYNGSLSVEVGDPNNVSQMIRFRV